MKRFRDRSWYTYAVALCIAVLLYVALTHLGAIGGFLSDLGGYFAPVVLGCIFAYMINPLAMLYQRKLFKNLKKASWGVSVGLAILTVVVAFLLLLVILIPQLINSVTTFAANFDKYEASFEPLLVNLGLPGLDSLFKSSENLWTTIYGFLQSHLDNIASMSAGVAKATINIALGLVLSIYLLLAKSSLKKGCDRLFHASVSERTYRTTITFMGRCDKILIRYIVFSLLDAVIIGVATAIFMLIMHMPYVGLISVIVGVFNLIPTFGPLIGTVLAGLLLLLINPWQALLIVVFSILLQIFDGYILKPKLFGNTLGVSGLLILVFVIVMGNIFGVIGILLAIPMAAICDYVYHEATLPALEKRRARKNAAQKVGKEDPLYNDFTTFYEDATDSMMESSYASEEGEEAPEGEGAEDPGAEDPDSVEPVEPDPDSVEPDQENQGTGEPAEPDLEEQGAAEQDPEE